MGSHLTQVPSSAYKCYTTNLSQRVVHSRRLRSSYMTLIDRGANGSIIGADWRVIARHDSLPIDCTGLHDHTIPGLQLVQAGAVCKTQKGPVLLIVFQGASLPGGKTILSPLQLEDFGCTISDAPPSDIRPHPHIRTPEGYAIPMVIQNGLPYIACRPFTDEEARTLPRVQLTSSSPWDHAKYDSNVPKDWFQSQPVNAGPFHRPPSHDHPSDDAFSSSDRDYQALDRPRIREVMLLDISGELCDTPSNRQAFSNARQASTNASSRPPAPLRRSPRFLSSPSPSADGEIRTSPPTRAGTGESTDGEVKTNRRRNQRGRRPRRKGRHNTHKRRMTPNSPPDGSDDDSLVSSSSGFLGLVLGSIF